MVHRNKKMTIIKREKSSRNPSLGYFMRNTWIVPPIYSYKTYIAGGMLVVNSHRRNAADRMFALQERKKITEISITPSQKVFRYLFQKVKWPVMLLKMYWHIALHCINLQKRRLQWTIYIYRAVCRRHAALHTRLDKPAFAGGGWKRTMKRKSGANTPGPRGRWAGVLWGLSATREEPWAEYRLSSQTVWAARLELMRFEFEKHFGYFKRLQMCGALCSGTERYTCMFRWILLVSQYNNWIKGIPTVDPLTAFAIIFLAEIFNYAGRIHGWWYFLMLRLNGRADLAVSCGQ